MIPQLVILHHRVVATVAPLVTAPLPAVIHTQSAQSRLVAILNCRESLLTVSRRAKILTVVVRQLQTQQLALSVWTRRTPGNAEQIYHWTL